MVQNSVSHVIGFPVVTRDGKQSVLVQLSEGNYIPGKTLVMQHGDQTRIDSFAAVFSSTAYVAWDMLLASQKRTLIATFAALTTGNSENLVSELFSEADAKVHGTSASLALYFCTLAKKLPAATASDTCYWYLTGAIQTGADAHWGKSLTPQILTQKKSAIDAIQDTPKLFIVWFDRDASQLTIPSKSIAAISPDFFDRISVDTSSNAITISITTKELFLNDVGVLAKTMGIELRTPALNPDKKTDPHKLPDEDPPAADTFGTLIKRALKTYSDEGLKTATAAVNFITQIPANQKNSDFNRALEKFELQRNALDDTKLQQDIPLPKLLWDTECDYERRHVLIAGPTGCGKTALVDALVLRAILGQEGMALYIAPTRALAGEFRRNFLFRYKALFETVCIGKKIEDEIVLSTGEHYTHDRKIREASVSLACVVTEKANVLCAATEAGLLSSDSKLRLVVFDELHCP